MFTGFSISKLGKDQHAVYTGFTKLHYCHPRHRYSSSSSTKGQVDVGTIPLPAAEDDSDSYHSTASFMSLGSIEVCVVYVPCGDV